MGVGVDLLPSRLDGCGVEAEPHRVQRTVAQLDFYDFISVAELSADRVNAGNANLQPQRAWEFRLTADRPIFGDGLFKLDLGHDRISMLQDRILIFDEDGEGFDAPGNIGTGKHSFAQLTVDAPLGRLWNGLRVKANGLIRRTRVEDPISGKMRNFTGFYADWEWGLDVRRDAGPWSYGFVVNDRAPFTFFRTDEFDINFNGGPYGTAFVEYRPDPRTSITFDVVLQELARWDDVVQPWVARSARLDLDEFADHLVGVTGGGELAKEFVIFAEEIGVPFSQEPRKG